MPSVETETCWGVRISAFTCCRESEAKWPIFTLLDWASVSNLSSAFSGSKTKRLSCGCLSRFLVTGHSSRFPFWTASYLLTYTLPQHSHTPCNVHLPGWADDAVVLEAKLGKHGRVCVCGFFGGFFCFVLFVFIFLFFSPLPSFWIFSLCHYLFCYCTKTMCTLYQMYSFSLALSPGSACSFYILVSFSPPPLPAHHHLLHYGVKFGYVCTPCLWSPPALLRCVHCITTRR